MPTPELENTRFVDQKLGEVQRLLAAAPETFLRQGAVVASWRTYRGTRRGPYFRLAFRKVGRQKSVYLGKSLPLATAVLELLAELQRPVRERRKWARCLAQVRRQIRDSKAVWARELAVRGLSLKGFEVRGWRALQRAAVAQDNAGASRSGP